MLWKVFLQAVVISRSAKPPHLSHPDPFLVSPILPRNQGLPYLSFLPHTLVFTVLCPECIVVLSLSIYMEINRNEIELKMCFLHGPRDISWALQTHLTDSHHIG